MRDSDDLWIEQENYQKTRDPRKMCEALQKVKPYKGSTIPGQCEKKYWGSRKLQIADQFAKYVPAMYVPDMYPLARAGLSGRLRPAVAALVGDTPVTVAIAGAHAHQELAITAPQDATDTDAVRKYDKRVDDANLIALCTVNSNGRPMTITNSTEKNDAAAKLGVRYGAVKRALQRLEDKGLLMKPT